MKNLADSLDLQLDGIKVGDELTILDESGKVSANIYRVKLIENARVIAENSSGRGRTSWLTKNKGGAPWAMHNQSEMKFYHSANPLHIAQAKKNAKAIKAAEDKKKTEFNIILDLARPVGKELGDGWQGSAWDGEDSYSESVAVKLAQKLTSEQIKMLASWLGV